MKKKILGIVVAIVLVTLLLFLTGCGNDAQNNNEINQVAELEQDVQENNANTEQLYLVKAENEKYGYIDRDGNVVIDFQYDDAGYFTDGLATVKQGNEWGYIDEEGNVIIDFKYNQCSSFKDGIAIVLNQENKCNFINKDGDDIIKNSSYIGITREEN